MIHKNRGNRRHQNYTKAIRKEGLYYALYGHDVEIPLGKFIKGKVHCSCPICRAKTNKQKARYGTTGPGSKNYCHSEMKQVVAFHQDMKELLMRISKDSPSSIGWR